MSEADEDQWDEYDFVGECDHCGNERPVCHLPDPFVEEVYPDEKAEESDWCYPCWSDRKADV